MKFKIDVCVEVLLNFENVDSGRRIFPPFKNSITTIRRGIGQATEKKLKLSLNFKSSLRVYHRTKNVFGLLFCFWMNVFLATVPIHCEKRLIIPGQGEFA
jgi:hypothetical protein